MLAIFLALVMHGLEIFLDTERPVAFEYFRAMVARGGLVAERGMAGGQERMVQMVGSRDAGERGDRLGIAARHEERAAEMVPEPLRVIRVEPHRLLDPGDAFLGAPEPGQH